jgi:hypothetical protein
MSLNSGALRPWPTAPPGSRSLGATSRNEGVTIHPTNDSSLCCLWTWEAAIKRLEAEVRKGEEKHQTEAEPRAHYIVKGQCDLGALAFFYLRSRRQGALLDSLRERSVR